MSYKTESYQKAHACESAMIGKLCTSCGGRFQPDEFVSRHQGKPPRCKGCDARAREREEAARRNRAEIARAARARLEALAQRPEVGE